jgi:SAM-dependent methyltransferase
MDKSIQAVKVYDKIAQDYNKEFYNHSEYVDEFLDLIPKNGKILDVGCGAGRDSGYMSSKKFKIIGLDLSQEMLTIAKQNAPCVEFRLKDIRKLDFCSNSFDGILASCSLIHIPKKDVPNLIRNFYKILKAEGIIYIALQGGASEEVFIDEPFKPDEKLFLNVISFDEIKGLLINNGFSIIKKYEHKSKSEKELNYTKLYIIAKRS